MTLQKWSIDALRKYLLVSRIFQTMIFFIQEDVIHLFDLGRVSGNFTNYVSVSVTPTHRPARPNMYLRSDYLPSLKKQNCFEVVPPRWHTITDFFLSLSSPSSSHPPRCDTITDPLKKIELFKALASPAFIGNSYRFLYKSI